MANRLIICNIFSCQIYGVTPRGETFLNGENGKIAYKLHLSLYVNNAQPLALCDNSTGLCPFMSLILTDVLCNNYLLPAFYSLGPIPPRKNLDS